MTNASEPRVVLVTMDLRAGMALLSRSDGKEARVPIDIALAPTSSLSVVRWAPGAPALLAETTHGDVVVFEMPTHAQPEPLRGRPVVYLDQNHWSREAEPDRGGGPGRAAEQAAAEELAGLARAGKVVLPASSGHYTETTASWDPVRRYRRGLTVLQLSRGWQLRDPLQVRRDELHDAFRRAFAGGTGRRMTPVVTLRPNALHGTGRGSRPYRAPENFPPDAALAHESLVCATALIDTMLDAERIQPGGAAGWAKANQGFSDWLAGTDRDGRRKRQSVDALLVSDLSREIAEEAHASGITPEQMGEWTLTRFADDVRSLPALGLMREVVQDRHLNGSRWKPNDLVDITYLTCAAGYADVVVCERSACDSLRRSQRRLGRPATVFATLREAVPAIAAAAAT